MRTLDPTRPGRLRGTTVFLSASVPNRPGFERVANAPFVIEQAVVSLARAVFAENGKIVFGAHPSISPLVASVAAEYHLPGAPEQDRSVIIYQSHAFDAVLPTETWDMYRFGFANLVWTDAQNGERYVKDTPASRNCPQSLRHMRIRMIAETRPRIMVIVGGMEGVVEEIRLFREFWEKPNLPPPAIFVAKLTGGVARSVAAERGARFFHILEEEWPGASLPLESSAGKDPRSEPIPPYRAMMQWLVTAAPVTE